MTPSELSELLDSSANLIHDGQPTARTELMHAAAAMLREAERLLAGSQSAHVPGSKFAAQWNYDRQQWLEGRS